MVGLYFSHTEAQSHRGIKREEREVCGEVSDVYSYTVRLADTDAARVVYFTSILRICHEAYEDVLGKAGISLGQFLGESGVAIPIVSCEARFFSPMCCGDRLWIVVRSQLVGETEFKLNYQIMSAVEGGKILAVASTQHVCIDIQSRRRCHLPNSILQWIEKGFEY
jgi:1,4-dihydroxy-2-naphthoyl-CoA hydrolase